MAPKEGRDEAAGRLDAMVAVCKRCGHDMDAGVSCLELAVEFPDGDRLPPVAYGSEKDDWGAARGESCRDCGVRPGGFHHQDCDVERCPACGAQRHDGIAC
jgi:site-specific DNA recombinase